MATFTAPPWIAMLQAHADQAENDPRRRGTENPARDIANSAYEDIVGPRPATHRGARS